VEINFDAAATSGFDPSLLAGLHEFANFPNPSAIHRGGQRARATLDKARNFIKNYVLGPYGGDFQVIFTSGATESNNLSLLGDYQRILTSKGEHSSVYEPLQLLKKRGALVTFDLTLTQNQPFDLISLMAVNNEVGEVLPVAETLKVARGVNPKVVTHSDWSQVVGKLPLNDKAILQAIPLLDLISLSGHKFGALPGVGILLTRKGISLPTRNLGGTQENGFRGGTQNLPGIFTIPLALKALSSEGGCDTEKCANYREIILSELHQANIRYKNNGECLPRSIAGIMSLSITGVKAAESIIACDLVGLLISNGAACNSGKDDPRVLLAYGVAPEDITNTIRISFSSMLQESDVITGAKILATTLRRLQNQ
jgi:cysteine desulfurase